MSTRGCQEVFSPRFLVLFSAVGYVAVGLVAIAVALSAYVPYDDSPRRALGSVLTLACGGMVLGLGLVPLVAWVREVAQRAAPGSHR